MEFKYTFIFGTLSRWELLEFMMSRIITPIDVRTGPFLPNTLRFKLFVHLVPTPLQFTSFIYQMNLRTRRIWALANISARSEVARSLDDSLREFLQISSSTQRSELDAMDAIRIIKLCRTSLQPSRIAVIWPCILKIDLLPAKDDKTSLTLMGSVVSATLEAQDSSTAASVWEFVRSSPWLPVHDSIVIQLLGALCDRPDLVMELVTELLQGRLGVRAQVKYLNAALKALSTAPKEAKRIFELASERNMVYPYYVSLVTPLHICFQNFRWTQ